MKAVRELESMSEIKRVFELQKANQYAVGNSNVRERKAKLEKLRKAVEVDFREEIRTALKADFGKHRAEVDLAEIFPVTHEIRHAKRHLRNWMKAKRVPTPLAFAGGSSWIQYEPKGVCLMNRFAMEFSDKSNVQPAGCRDRSGKHRDNQTVGNDAEHVHRHPQDRGGDV